MEILLPGGDEQIRILLNYYDVSGKKILILGPGTSQVAKKFILNKAEKVIIITEDEQSLADTRLSLSGSAIPVRLMQFANTDFKSGIFDLIFVQGSVSRADRNAILKEVNRLLCNAGIFASGEVVLLKEPAPAFLRNVFDSSGLYVLTPGRLRDIYVQNNFLLLNETDLSNTLSIYYRKLRKKLNNNINNNKKNMILHKKLINRIKHESDVYLKLGGAEYTGYYFYILKKNEGISEG